MTRTMYDAVTPGNIPPSARLIAGYADGLYANLGEMRTRFPRATIVSIAVRYTTRAQVLDVETGDATPAQAVLWCTRTMADKPNGQLTVYCNTSTWPAVRSAFRAAGVSEPNYWVAQYDDVASIPPGALAKQYRDPGPYDQSVVADYWPGVDPEPAPPPAPKPAPAPAPAPTFLEDDMLAYLPPIPANTDVDLPVEPAGTTTAPQGGAKNGPMWLALAPQGADGTAAVSLRQNGKWTTAQTHTVTRAGGKLVVGLPQDGSVDVVRVHSTVPLVGYVVGRQVA